MKRDDRARELVVTALGTHSLYADRDAGIPEVKIRIDDRAHVQYNADGSRAFVEAIIEVEMLEPDTIPTPVFNEFSGPLPEVE